MISVVTTHLGKFPLKKINDIRDIIFEEMMGRHVEMMGGHLVNTEILYCYLVDKMNVGKMNAAALALKSHGGGRVVSSRGLKEVLIDNNYELEQRQVTQFIKRFLKSTRIEVLDGSPTTWQMNGFSTQEPPYLAGYERGGPEVVAIQTAEKDTFVELVNRRRELKTLIQQKEQHIQQDNIIPELISERNELKIELEDITHQLSNLHS